MIMQIPSLTLPSTNSPAVQRPTVGKVMRRAKSLVWSLVWLLAATGSASGQTSSGAAPAPAPDPGTAALPPVDRRPNLVLILADDLGWADSKPYGHPALRTPHLDRFAKEGLRFDRAYVTASSCSPSRASLITGRYPHNTQAEELHWPVPADQVTFVEKLREAGYWAGAAGKWHLGDAIRDRFDVIHEADVTGYQLPVTGKEKPEAPAVSSSKKSTGKNREKKAPKQEVPPVPPDGSGCTDWVPLLRERPKDKPFFAWLASIDPHREYAPGSSSPPHRSEEVRLPPYLADSPETRADVALYYDEIERFDRYLGDVLAELESQQVLENTLIIFLSDNGRPFPREKTTLYEGGIRVPMMARWPGKIAPGKVTQSLVSSLDVAPSFLKAAGIENLPETFAGRSLLPLFANPGLVLRDFLFAEKNWHDFEDHSRVVLGRRYKYIRNDYPDLPLTPPADALRSPSFGALRKLRDAGKLSLSQQGCFQCPRPREELYDLKLDPWELNNLAAEPAFDPVRETLAGVMKEWERRTGDFVAELRTPDEFDRETGESLENRKRPRPSKKEMVESGLASP